MISLYPTVSYQAKCPECSNELKDPQLLWQGLHICLLGECCKQRWMIELPIGHGLYHQCQINLTTQKILTPTETAQAWLARPLLESYNNPQSAEIELKVEKFSDSKKVIILNCIDSYYGHGLLKLLNAQSHLENDSEYGLVVIVPEFLRWLVPDGVAQIWSVDIKLKDCAKYYPSLQGKIMEQVSKLEEAVLSPAYSHPNNFDISNFTRTPLHDMDADFFRINFIWREDRPWISNRFLLKHCRPRNNAGLKEHLVKIPLSIQRNKVIELFRQIRKVIPMAVFTVSGLGTYGEFPEWIEDVRVDSFDETEEKNHAKIYSQSRLVIGLTGSNMLLPSAHAGMSLDLVPHDKWGNLTHDILYGKRTEGRDPRELAYHYRYINLNCPIEELGHICVQMVDGFEHSVELFNTHSS